MDWFDPNKDVVIDPRNNRVRLWKRKYGMESIEISQQVLFANNGHGKLFDAIAEVLDQCAEVIHDHRSQGYIHYKTPHSFLTLYQSPDPAPYAAANLEFAITGGAQQILFINGTGSLCPDIPVGSIVLPGELIREEGTSYHYVPENVLLKTSSALNKRIKKVAGSLGIKLSQGKHWTTDAIHRETYTKVERLKREGVISVEMELSALAGVAAFWKCELAAILVVTDVLSKEHTWDGLESVEFQKGIKRAAQVAARLFL